MKKLFTILLLALAFLNINAQAPQGISYQAIAFNNGGTPVANGNVGIRISILDNSATGTIIYSETHTKPTNAQGLFNLNIGQGTATTGNFASISWGTNTKFLKVELDATSGTNYTTVGTNQLMSVPYALYAENVNTAGLGKLVGSTTIEGKGNMLVVYTSSNGYALSQSGTNSDNSFWNQQPFSGQAIGSASSKNAIVVYTTSSAYAYHQSGTSSNTGFWNQQPLSGIPVGIAASDSQIVVYTTTNAYAFSKSGTSSNNGFWNQQPLSGTPLGATASANAVVVYTSSNAYSYHQSGTSSNTGFWDQQPLSGTTLGARASATQIVVFTSSNAYSFTKSGTSSNNSFWNQQPMSGTPLGIINNK
jgi:hypothetical protein